ncbi:response regulator transcription factor [Prosthecobacter sp.]|uniref:response regulator transcription factor n=1 Tax=Prosthecobacter sp. TaxID=1965333 RepID=UPI0024895836|nr:response regulator transcription factor [Prosthecobacter sp.]MDI1313277.1 response regulator transcription factor [Prosthecobacter sp.]
MSNSSRKSHHRTAVVEDDPVYRAYLTSLLKNTAEVEWVHAWESAEAMLADTHLPAVELLFVDLELPGISGLELISQLKKLQNPPVCVVLTSSLEPEHVFSAIRGGASGYLVKTLEPQAFLESLRQVIKDGVSLSPFIARMLIDEFRGSPPHPEGGHNALKNLTIREREVLDSMARNCSAKGVGEALRMSHETVRVHMKKIYQKLHVNSKSAALAVLAQEKQS